MLWPKAYFLTIKTLNSTISLLYSEFKNIKYLCSLVENHYQFPIISNEISIPRRNFEKISLMPNV